MWARWARRPSSVESVSSVVRQLPATPRLLQWTCTGCGRPSSWAAGAIDSMTCRGVTPATSASSEVTLPAPRLQRSFPPLDPAGVDELHAVAAGRLEPPRNRVAHARRVAADQVEQRDVVAEQDEEERVDHRRVAQLAEDVAGGGGRGGGRPRAGGGGA